MTYTPTQTGTPTETRTPTVTPTPSFTPIPTKTGLATATYTPLPPPPSRTPTITLTPSLTPTKVRQADARRRRRQPAAQPPARRRSSPVSGKSPTRTAPPEQTPNPDGSGDRHCHRHRHAGHGMGRLASRRCRGAAAHPHADYTATPTRQATATPTTDPQRPGVIRTVRPTGLLGTNALVVDRATGVLWVAGRESDAVYALSLSSLATLQRIGVGDAPFGLDVLNGILYVANFQDGMVSRILTGPRTRLPDIPVGDEPSWVAADPIAGRVWVPLHRGGGVAALVYESVWRKVATGPGAFAAAVDVAGRRVYVGNRDSKDISALDADSGDRLWNLGSGGSPFGMAVNQATGVLYVLHGPPGGDCPASRLVIYERSGMAVRDVPVGDTCPGGMVTVNPANGRVYVAATAENKVWVLNGDGSVRSILTAADGIGRQPLGLAVDRGDVAPVRGQLRRRLGDRDLRSVGAGSMVRDAGCGCSSWRFLRLSGWAALRCGPRKTLRAPWGYAILAPSQDGATWPRG